jgi:hypothetical protein
MATCGGLAVEPPARRGYLWARRRAGMVLFIAMTGTLALATALVLGLIAE